MDGQRFIVVGHDGSDFSDMALRRAFWLAQRVGDPVRIVRAWTISTAPRPKTWEPGYVPPADDFEAAVRERLEHDVRAIVGQFPDVATTLETPHGAAGKELIKLSETARLVVVGGRGAGGFSGLMMGAVSGQVVQHAKCDVLVVRREEPDQAPDRQIPLDRTIDT